MSLWENLDRVSRLHSFAFLCVLLITLLFYIIAVFSRLPLLDRLWMLASLLLIYLILMGTEYWRLKLEEPEVR